MPYIAPEQASRAARLALASERWRAILTATPELAPAVALQQQLVELLLDLSDAIETRGLPRLSLPPRYVATKLTSRVPALIGEPIPLPIPLVEPALIRLCEALGRGGAGEAADHIRTWLTERRLDIGSLLTASLGRDQQAIRQGALHRGLSPDLLWLVAELAVSPFAHALEPAVFAARTQTDLRSALDGWTLGYCPLCGSWPALAEATTLHRALRCSFCSLAWERSTVGCAYCGDTGERFHNPDSSEHDGLELCGTCSSYLKVVGVPELSPFPLVAIGDLETMRLDAAAMERGYARPSMLDFRAQRAAN
jgi:FdhE protein